MQPDAFTSDEPFLTSDELRKVRLIAPLRAAA